MTSGLQVGAVFDGTDASLSGAIVTGRVPGRQEMNDLILSEERSQTCGCSRVIGSGV